MQLHSCTSSLDPQPVGYASPAWGRAADFCRSMRARRGRVVRRRERVAQLRNLSANVLKLATVPIQDCL
jgi:hypothetical protein